MVPLLAIPPGWFHRGAILSRSNPLHLILTNTKCPLFSMAPVLWALQATKHHPPHPLSSTLYCCYRVTSLLHRLPHLKRCLSSSRHWGILVKANGHYCERWPFESDQLQTCSGTHGDFDPWEHVCDISQWLGLIKFPPWPLHHTWGYNGKLSTSKEALFTSVRMKKSF